MNTTISPEIRAVIESVGYRPCISIIMPFEPKMESKPEMKQRLKLAVDQVAREIRNSYQDELATQVIRKLRSTVNDLDYSTYKKSIAIFVSPVFKKVFYFDVPVEQQIIIDRSFHIRDVLHARKERNQCLIMVLSAKSSKIYLNDGNMFNRLAANFQEQVPVADLPEKVSNFSDPIHKKEVALKKFLHYTDKGLTALLHDYPLPVFVLGTRKVSGYFNELTKNSRNIAANIHGNYEQASTIELIEVLRPYIDNWKNIKMIDLLHQIEKASDCGKLVTGIVNVRKQAALHKGRLLIVGQNFHHDAEKGSQEDATEPYHKFSYIKDAVDDVIAMVLNSGGDVEFVDDAMLSHHDHICLIKFY